MPTYDYVCSSCGHALEIFHSMTEAAKRKCPACGKSKLERKIGAGAGFLFKGEGFYKTDYRSDSYKAGLEAEKPPVTTEKAALPPAGEKGGDSKSPDSQTPAPKKADSKPEAQSKPKTKSKKSD